MGDSKRQRLTTDMTDCNVPKSTKNLSDLPEEVLSTIIALVTSDVGFRYFKLAVVSQQWRRIILSGKASPKVSSLSVNIRSTQIFLNKPKKCTVIVLDKSGEELSGDVSGTIDQIMQQMLPRKGLLLKLHLMLAHVGIDPIQDVNDTALQLVTLDTGHSSYLRSLQVDGQACPILATVLDRHADSLQSITGSSISKEVPMFADRLLEEIAVLRNLQIDSLSYNYGDFNDPEHLKQMVHLKQLLLKHEKTLESLELSLHCLGDNAVTASLLMSLPRKNDNQHNCSTSMCLDLVQICDLTPDFSVGEFANKAHAFEALNRLDHLTVVMTYREDFIRTPFNGGHLHQLQAQVVSRNRVLDRALTAAVVQSSNLKTLRLIHNHTQRISTLNQSLQELVSMAGLPSTTGLDITMVCRVYEANDFYRYLTMFNKFHDEFPGKKLKRKPGCPTSVCVLIPNGFKDGESQNNVVSFEITVMKVLAAGKDIELVREVESRIMKDFAVLD